MVNVREPAWYTRVGWERNEGGKGGSVRLALVSSICQNFSDDFYFCGTILLPLCFYSWCLMCSFPWRHKLPLQQWNLLETPSGMRVLRERNSEKPTLLQSTHNSKRSSVASFFWPKNLMLAAMPSPLLGPRLFSTIPQLKKKGGGRHRQSSLHNRRYFFGSFRRAKVSTPRSLRAYLPHSRRLLLRRSAK